MAPSRGTPGEPHGTAGPCQNPLSSFPVQARGQGMQGSRRSEGEQAVLCHAWPCHGEARQHHALLDQAVPCGTTPNHAATAMPGRTSHIVLDHATPGYHGHGEWTIPWPFHGWAMLCPCCTKPGYPTPSHAIVSLLDQTTPRRTMPFLAFVAVPDHISPC